MGGTLVLPMNSVAEILDDVVGQQLAAHLLDPLARGLLGVGPEPHLQVLADADVLHLVEAKRSQRLLDGEALGVVDDRLRRHDDSCDQASALTISGSPTSRS